MSFCIRILGYLVDSIAKTIDAGCKRKFALLNCSQLRSWLRCTFLLVNCISAYMAPERIDPSGNPGQYDIRSDVWSLGISMVEMATGKFPYNTWLTPFEQLKQVRCTHILQSCLSQQTYKILTFFNYSMYAQVVKDEPPRLEAGRFSPAFDNFITACLQKKYTDRPNYEQLLQHAFLVEHMNKVTDVASFVEQILNLPDV